jgi:hypothetical protein
MAVFPVEVDHALEVSIERIHDADPRGHRWSARLDTDFSLGPAMGATPVELLSRKDDGAAADALEIDNPVGRPAVPAAKLAAERNYLAQPTWECSLL